MMVWMWSIRESWGWGSVVEHLLSIVGLLTSFSVPPVCSEEKNQNPSIFGLSPKTLPFTEM